jgi:acyl-CoA synthetase (NDP forming)
MHPLKDLMYPSSIAVWGASTNPLKMGTMQLANIIETGFKGEIYPIHPSNETVLGLKAYRSAADVGRKIDLAQLTLPTEIVPQVLEECGRAGIRSAIVISGGFKEVEGRKGKELEKTITAIAKSYGIRFIGPNCVGVCNSTLALNTTTVSDPPLGGKIAFASQSGAYTSMIYPYLRAAGLKVCQTLSVGNEADMDLTDCLEYLKDEDEVQAVGLYVEAIRRPRQFIEAAKTLAARKPVVAFYVGGTAAGSRSSLSHTGAITGPDELYDGLFRQAGVIRTDDMDSMIDALWILSSQPLPPGNRMAVITNSGGPGSSLAYHLEKAGLSVPPFSPELKERLAAATAATAYVGNPIDITFDTNIYIYKQLLEEVFRSEEVDGAFIYGIFGATDFLTNVGKFFPELWDFRDKWEENYHLFLAELAGVPKEFRKPLVVMSLLGTESLTIRNLIEHDVPVYPSASRAVGAMRSLLDYGAARSRS